MAELLNIVMVHLDDMFKTNRTAYELQELLIFCITTPAYFDITRLQLHSEKIDMLMFLLGANENITPFQKILTLRSSELTFLIKSSKIEFADTALTNISYACMLTNDELRNGSLDEILSKFAYNVSIPIRRFLQCTRPNQDYVILDKYLIENLRKNGYWCPKRIRSEEDYRDIEHAARQYLKN